MTSLRTLASEEPIAPNSSVTALDESTQRLVLAEFSVDNACRYSVRWERRALFFDKESLEALAALCALLSLQAHFVVGWKHDTLGPLRLRHLHLLSNLKKSAWQIHAQEGIGLAAIELVPSELLNLHKSISTRDVGWFIVFGAHAPVDVLLQKPFRNSFAFFCWTHELTPSIEFLEGLGTHFEAIAFCTQRDDRQPTVQLVTSRPLRNAIEKAFGFESS